MTNDAPKTREFWIAEKHPDDNEYSAVALEHGEIDMIPPEHLGYHVIEYSAYEAMVKANHLINEDRQRERAETIALRKERDELKAEHIADLALISGHMDMIKKLEQERAELRDWIKANVHEMECRTDGECDHCVGLDLIGET